MTTSPHAASTASGAGVPSPTPEDPGSPSPSGGRDMPRAITLLVFIRDRGIFVLWAVFLAVFSFWCSPYFATVDNALLIANAAALTAVFAAGVGIGVMTGVLDLSLPGTAAFASCVCGWLLTHGHPTWLSLVAGLACGVLVGIVNGLVSLAGFNPIIITIATLSILTGLASIVAGGFTFPGLTQLTFMGTDRYLGVPAPVYIVAVVYLIGTVFLTRTRDGLRLMAVGGNAEAVRRSGIHTPVYQVLGFAVSGTFGALGGLIATAVTTEANPQASPSIIFTALTAVALAGVSLSGGQGSLPRILVGSLILATITNGLTIRGIQPYWATVITGVLLLGSLTLDRVLQRAVAERLVSHAHLSAHDRTVR